MALAVAAVLEPSLMNAMLAIASLWWTWHTRLVYSMVRQIRALEYVEAAETLGASKTHILFREILPNCVSAIAVKTSLDAGFVILIGASLSFLGLGIQPPTPDLGTMVSDGASFLPDYWWESLLPGSAILFVALGFIATFGHYLIVMAYDRAEASLLAPLAYIEMIMAVAVGWWFFGDFPDGWTFVGVAILISCAIYISVRERSKKPPLTPEAA